MQSLIEEIHALLDFPSDETSSRRAQILTRLDTMVQQVQDAFGLDFVDRFTELYALLYTNHDCEEFRQGFITGARLMWEILGE